MARPKTTDRDLGYKKILKEINKVERSPHVKVGFPVEKSETKEKHSGSKATVVEIAIFHEFGTSTGIPQRSFIRATFDEQKEKWLELTGKLHLEIYKGNMDVAKALAIIGLRIETDQKNKIRSGIPPELKFREGTPLIDTAQMINSIQFQVVM